MLASITPLGERSRNARWGVTVFFFALASIAASLAVGALAGEAGALILGPATPPAAARRAVLAAGLALAAVGDLASERSLPWPRRQVDERWLRELRGWAYGAGFGAQLGAAVATVVTSAATYVMLLGALLAGRLAPGAAIVGVYGVLRGASLLATGRVRDPSALVALHRRLRASEARVRYSTAALLALLALVLAGVA
jgi:hypothetical protein